MSYATIEAAIQTILQGIPRSLFAEADVTRADWRVLDSGSGPYAVLFPGPFDSEEAGDHGEKHMVWTTYCELYQRYLDGGTSETALESTRQDVVQRLWEYPTLNGVTGVTRSHPVRAEPLQYVYDADGGGPHFVMQQLTILTDQYVNVDGSGEFA